MGPHTIGARCEATKIRDTGSTRTSPRTVTAKKKCEQKSSKDTEEVTEGNIALEIVDCAFLAILWLLRSMILGKILDEYEYYVLFSGIEVCYAFTIYYVYFKLVCWRVLDKKINVKMLTTLTY